MSIRELRVALAVERFEEAVALYSCGLGLPVRQAWKEHSGRGVLLDAGSATPELLSTGGSSIVDRIEMGRPAHQAIRLAFGVDDLAEMARILASGGATVLGGPAETPWGHRNARRTGRPTDHALFGPIRQQCGQVSE